MALKGIKGNNVLISVYRYQEEKEGQEGFIYPLRVSKEMNDRHVNLLLVADDDTNHYCFIKNLGRLVGSIINQRTLVWKRRQTSNEYSIILL